MLSKVRDVSDFGRASLVGTKTKGVNHEAIDFEFV